MADDLPIDPTKSSKYNEAMLKMLRINKGTEKANDCSSSPLEINNEVKDWNFNIWIKSQMVVFSEIHSKLNEKEAQEVIQSKIRIEKFLLSHPVMELRKIHGKKMWVPNIEVWETIKPHIEKLDLLVRELKDKHGFGSPDKDDIRRAAAKRG